MSDVKKQMDNRKVLTTLELIEPIEWGDELIEKVVIHRPKGKQFRAMLRAGDDPSSKETAYLTFMGDCCDLTTAQLDELDGEDWMTINGFLSPFFDKAAQGSKTS